MINWKMSSDDVSNVWYFINYLRPGWLNELGSWLPNNSYKPRSPIQREFAPGFVNYKKGCTRLAAASDKVYQLLAHGRWFSPGTLASFTTKTGRHDIQKNVAEILLKVALKHQKSSLPYDLYTRWYLLSSVIQ